MSLFLETIHYLKSISDLFIYNHIFCDISFTMFLAKNLLANFLLCKK